MTPGSDRLRWAVRFVGADDLFVASAEHALHLVRRQRRLDGVRRALGLAPAAHRAAPLEPTEGRRLLAAAVGSLSSLQRAALAFVDGCGLTVPDVADGLGVPRWRLQRALVSGRAALRRAVALPPLAADAALDPFVGPALRALRSAPAVERRAVLVGDAALA